MNEDYTMKQYLIDSERTAAPNGSVGREMFPTDVSLLRQLLEVVQMGHTCDAMKRSLFYKDTNENLGKRLKAASEKLVEQYKKLDANPSIEIPEADFYLIHSIIGIVSEVGEVVEEYVNAHLENRPMDKVNLKEEFGDIMWYEAMGLRYAETTHEDAAYTNIQKLKARFPDKFAEDKAITRDLETERKVLEGEAA